MSETTLVGIDSEIRDKAKMHVLVYKHKYESMVDLVNQAVTQFIEDDEHDNDTTTNK
jgi:hypothetical protein